MPTPTIPPTRTFMNFINTIVTPPSGTAVQIVSVTKVKPVRKCKIQSFYGDAAAGARVKAATEQERGMTITSGDVATLLLIPMGVPCTVTSTLLDPVNGATPGGGAIQMTLVNAIVSDDSSEGDNNRFANGTVSFEAFWSVDGSGNLVDPLTITRL